MKTEGVGMKRNAIIVLMILALVTLLTSPAYCDDPVKKLGRGLSNMLSFPFEVPLQVSRINESDGPVAAGTWGILKGLGMAGCRLVAGAYETVGTPEEDLPMRVRTSSAPTGNLQENSGVLPTYHFVESGCVGDVMPSAFSIPAAVTRTATG